MIDFFDGLFDDFYDDFYYDLAPAEADKWIISFIGGERCDGTLSAEVTDDDLSTTCTSDTLTVTET